VNLIAAVPFWALIEWAFSIVRPNIHLHSRRYDVRQPRELDYTSFAPLAPPPLPARKRRSQTARPNAKIAGTESSPAPESGNSDASCTPTQSSQHRLSGCFSEQAPKTDPLQASNFFASLERREREEKDEYTPQQMVAPLDAFASSCRQMR